MGHAGLRFIQTRPLSASAYDVGPRSSYGVDRVCIPMGCTMLSLQIICISVFLRTSLFLVCLFDTEGSWKADIPLRFIPVILFVDISKVFRVWTLM